MKAINKIKLLKSGVYPAPLFVNKNIGGGKIVAPNRPNIKTKLLKSGAGFTLIELLVVIAIISLLASVVLVALNSTRQKAKMAKLNGDLAQIEKGINLARDSQNAVMGLVSGNYCTRCGLTSETVNSQPAILATINASWKNLGFASSPKDPWGSPYVIDENEQEGGPGNCTYDIITSAGPNGIFEGGYIDTPGVPAQVVGDDYIYAVSHWVCP